MHDFKHEKYKFPLYSLCSSCYCRICSEETESLPISRINTAYEIQLKTHHKSMLSFPIKVKDLEVILFLQIQKTKVKNNEIFQSFGLKHYELLPRNQPFLLEKYPYFIVSQLNETNLTFKIERRIHDNINEDISFNEKSVNQINIINQRMELSNNELQNEHFLDIFINYLAYKLYELMNIDLTFCLYLQLTPFKSYSSLKSLSKFSDFLIKFDQSFLYETLYRKKRKNFDVFKENDLFFVDRKNMKRNSYMFQEKDLIIGNLKRHQNCMISTDLVIINYFQVFDNDLIMIFKEILMKGVSKALSFSKNLVIILHKSFPLQLLPEILDTSLSYIKEEPKNFSIEIELLLLNSLFEGYFVYWGDPSTLTYEKTSDFLLKTLYPMHSISFSKFSSFDTNIELLNIQQKLLKEKFEKHGLRIFEKVIFSYKSSDPEEEPLYNLLLYLLNNSLITFHDIKVFPFFKKLIAASMKSHNSYRRTSLESKEKNLNSYNDDNSSYVEKSHHSKEKKLNISGIEFSNDEIDKSNSMFGFSKRNIEKTPKNQDLSNEMKRDASFKTVKSLLSKEKTGLGKSRDFNLILKNSMESQQDMVFSSYSGEDEVSDMDLGSFGKDLRVHKVEGLKKLYKNSWSFSFD